MARQLQPRTACRQLRCASTNQQAAAASASYRLVEDIEGGALVFLVRLSPFHSFASTSLTGSTDVLTGRLFLLPLLRRAKSIISAASSTKQQTPKTHHRPPKINARAQRSAAMAQIHSNQLRSLHPRRKSLRRERIRGSI
jgi:hypothetical protein